ncbi:MAG: hypothetical protein H6822_10195 [Planctomycetaceae bacterium]|nr:hypothetical protein [Planctomycetaceae bacterium]
MSILITCIDCNAKITAKDKLAGKRVKCPRCGATLQIPSASSDKAPGDESSSTPIPTATARQKEYARTLGIDFPADINVHDISNLIDAAVQKRDDERFDKLNELSDRESEAWNKMRTELLAEIDQEDCRLSQATPRQMVDELASRGRGAVLITFDFAEVEDFEHLSGVGFEMEFCEDAMSERDARMVMITTGHAMLQQETKR